MYFSIFILFSIEIPVANSVDAGAGVLLTWVYTVC